MPSRYYYKVVSSKGTTVRVVFVDTTPLIQRYRNNPEVYPDARMQNMEAQLQWLDATLRDAKEDWVIVVGHHPIYAQTEKNIVEQEDLRRCLLPVLQRYHNVSIYACGHIHDFQHIKMQGDDIDYVVNSAGALARDVKPIDGTVGHRCRQEAALPLHDRQGGQRYSHGQQEQEIGQKEKGRKTA